MKPMTNPLSRIRRAVRALIGDRSGLAAVEFALIIPLMITLFYGTDEFASAVAVNRKVTLMARTLSDLTSQNTTVTDTQFTNFFNASLGIMTPYASSPVNSTISELYVDPATLVARVQWSKGSAVRATSSTVAIPAALQVGGTYLIYSEVNYTYKATIGWFLPKSTGITLSDYSYTRPRQSSCVMYSTTVCTTS